MTTTSRHIDALSTSLGSPRLSSALGKEERHNGAHARSLITNWWLASDRDICKQKLRAQEKGRVWHFEPPPRATSCTGGFCEQLWPWALRAQPGLGCWGWKEWPAPEAVLQVPGMLYFLFRAFIARYWRYSVKMRLYHFNKAFLNLEGTAPSIKKLFSLVTFYPIASGLC